MHVITVPIRELALIKEDAHAKEGGSHQFPGSVLFAAQGAGKGFSFANTGSLRFGGETDIDIEIKH